MLFTFVCCSAAFSQELNSSVSIDRSQIESSSYSYLDDLDDEIETYLNEHNWTSDRYNDHERIDVEFQITLLSADDNYNFEATVVVLARRPIYNTLQRTTLFLFNDENWSFSYSPNRNLMHDELQYDDLATVLDFYAYLIIGLDYDSFAENGGSDYLNQASNLVDLARSSSGGNGWERSTSRQTRGRLISNLTSSSYSGYREALYRYHRLGLDRFTDEPEEARREILEALELIQNARRRTTSSLLFDSFFNAKYRELVAVFQDAAAEVRLDAYNLLADIDQSHLSTYDALQ
ncbi:MAG: DUF4835 family protein [Balneolaceae bacterium]